jgi:hypothetical protein
MGGLDDDLRAERAHLNAVLVCAAPQQLRLTRSRSDDHETWPGETHQRNLLRATGIHANARTDQGYYATCTGRWALAEKFKLTNLKTLWLSDTQVTGTGLVHLGPPATTTLE